MLPVALFYATMGNCALSYIPPADLHSSIKEISAPTETQQWLEAVLSYESDNVLYGKNDFWAPCALTYQNQKGDCEDYAICAAAILREDVEEGYIIAAANPITKSGHAVFAYRLGGEWGIVSNNTMEFRKPNYQSLQDVILDSLGGGYIEYYVFDYEEVNLVEGNEDLKSKLKPIGYFPL